MRPSKIRVAKYEHSATSKWVVEGLRNNAGKRSRRFFRTKAEADHFARDALAEQRQPTPRERRRRQALDERVY